MLRPPVSIRQALLVLLTFAALLAGGAKAHEIRPALAEIAFPEGEGRYQIAFVLNLEALIAGIGPEHDDTSEAPTAALYDDLRALDPAALRAEFDAFAPRFLEGLTVEADGAATTPAFVSLIVPPVGDLDLPRDSILTVGARLPEGTEALTFAWSPGFGNVVFRTAAADGEDGYSAFLTGGEASAPVPVEGAISQPGFEVFVDYIGVGFEHIVPLGLDHILFVVGLFLFSARLKPLLIQISAFTVAHTVTLALGLYGVVRIAPEIVEPLIALSIVYVAVENLFFRNLTPWRPVLVFAFGLLHGLGFAGVLEEFGLPAGQYLPALIGFNIGVELGQLAVVGACLLAFGFWFGEKPWYRRAIVAPGSLAVAAVGAFWVVERTLL